MPLLGEVYVLTALVEGWPAGTRVVVVEADDEGAVGVRPDDPLAERRTPCEGS